MDVEVPVATLVMALKIEAIVFDRRDLVGTEHAIAILIEDGEEALLGTFLGHLGPGRAEAAGQEEEGRDHRSA
jgi:hypothetical protein